MPTLFDPIRIGSLDLPNRIFMAPLTRTRATQGHAPTPIMARYYEQRARAALIVSEATGISREGLGWPYAPGIWSDEQIEGWKPVTEAVHRAGGHIFMQLWHMGRLVHPDMAGGATPISASATTAPGDAHSYAVKKPHVEARALLIEEIPALLDDFRTAARNALTAGFDGVQLHGAHGYLVDQFLRDSSNHREDDYGGPPENRVRLMREITKAIADEVGTNRTAVRLSLNGEANGVIDSDPTSLAIAAARALDGIGIAFLDLREVPADSPMNPSGQAPQSPIVRAHFSGPLVLNCDYTLDSAQAALAAGAADAIAFGRPFIGNPDLPERFRTGAVLSPSDMATWYGPDEKGYADYPALNKAAT